MIRKLDMKIYTKTGDKGQTSLVGGKRVSKADLRIEAYGTLDELNSWIGLIADVSEPVVCEKLRNIQNTLFNVGALLANNPEKPIDLGFEIAENDIVKQEKWIDEMVAEIAPLKQFILPGGHPNISYCHIARTVCRRAERLCVALSEQSPVNDLLIKYLNRLSDLLFTLARFTALRLNVPEVVWQVGK